MAHVDDLSTSSDASNGFPAPSQEVQQHDNYRTVVCSEESLRILSQRLSRMSVTNVGRCLGLADGVVQTAEEDRIHDGAFKMYHLLVEWRNGQEQANWGMLADCLRHLNDDSLMEKLRQIATEGHREGPSREVPPIQVHSQDVPRPGWSGNDPITEATPSKQLREDLEELQDDFSDILILVQTSFQSHSVPLEDVRLWVTKLCVDQKENIPAFDKSELKEVDNFSFNELFTFLTRHEVWDILNFRVLQRMVKRFIPNDEKVRERIAKYEPKANRFKHATILRDYIRVRASGPQENPAYSTVLVKIKTSKSFDNFTLAHVDEEEKFLANQFLLNQFIFRLKEGRRGCIQLTWLVPSSAISLLMPEEVAKSRKILKERGIVEIRVDNRYVYVVQNPDPHQAPRKLFPYNATENYDSMYQQSVNDPEKFWSTLAKKFLEWDQKFDKVNDCDKKEGIVRWFTGGKLNVSKNCLDRHVERYPERTAIIWEKDDQTHAKMSYRELLEQTCQIANVLRNQCEVKKGDVVVIYMPTMPLAVASMLACARIGAVHSVVFAVLPPEKLKERIIDNAKVLITADQAPIGGEVLPLKDKVDKALEGSTSIRSVLVAKRTNADVAMKEGRDISLEEAMMKESTECEPVSLDSEDELFVMYTSGMTGLPVGVVHTQAGYLLYAAITHKYVFDYQEGDVFACVAVLGWITGHSYVVYGPLCNGATTVLFESTATYPNPGRYWEMVERLKVNQFYTTPSAIRKLMRAGDEYVNKYDLSSMKTIGSVGEPLNTEAWKWYFEVVGRGKCILVDTWWQTETGGIAISPQPGPQDGNLKPCYSMRPFFGVEPLLTNDEGEELEGNGVQGLLCLRNPTPGMCRRIIGQGKSFKDDYFSYFKSKPGLYFTQDYAYRDVDGHYHIQGRKADIVRIKGVWLQVPEIETEMAKSDHRIEEVTIVSLCVPKKQEEGEGEGDTEAKDVPCTEDTAVVVEVKPGIKHEEHADIAKNVWQKGVYRAGLKAVPQGVFVTPRAPMTDSGKPSRMEMRREILKGGNYPPNEWSVDTNTLIFPPKNPQPLVRVC